METDAISEGATQLSSGDWLQNSVIEGGTKVVF